MKSGLFQKQCRFIDPNGQTLPHANLSNKSGLFDIFVRDLLQYFMGHRTYTSLYRMSSYVGELICRILIENEKKSARERMRLTHGQREREIEREANKVVS